MALLPSERPKQISLLVTIAALAGLYAAYEYWYVPRVLEVEALEARLTHLEEQNRQAEALMARAGDELEARLAIYERHVERLEELVPRGEEVPALLNGMVREARNVGVELTSIGPEPPLSEAFYTRQSYQMEAVGEYHDVGRFLSAVASLPRIVTPVDVVIEPFQGSAARNGMVAPVVVRFRIETYVLPGDGVPDDLPEILEEVGG